MNEATLTEAWRSGAPGRYEDFLARATAMAELAAAEPLAQRRAVFLDAAERWNGLAQAELRSMERARRQEAAGPRR